MVVIRRKYLWIIGLGLLFLIGFAIGVTMYQPHYRLGEWEIPLNPNAKINPKQTYHLTVWDYNYPLQTINYSKYLNQAIARFQQQYPNIKVQVKLLDLLEGPRQIAKALKDGNLPDVYCSAYHIPQFDCRWQIPVGPFCQNGELTSFRPEVAEMGKVAGVQCAFPRWVAPVVWIGNRQLLAANGLEVAKLTTNGWQWEDLLQTLERSKGSLKFAAFPGDGGFFGQLLMDGSGKISENNREFGVAVLKRLVSARATTGDYSNNAIGRFLAGRTLVIADGRLSLYRVIKDKTSTNQNATVDPVILPGPAKNGGRSYLRAENGVIAIYRNWKTRGDAHIAAAVRLGYFLSTYPGIEPWQEMMVYPAAIDSGRVWENRTGIAVGALLKPIALVNRNRPLAETPALRLLDEYLAGKKQLSDLENMKLR